MSAQQDLPLPSPAASNTVIINARCSLRIEADQRAIVVGGLPVHHYCADDAVADSSSARVISCSCGILQRRHVRRRPAGCGGCAPR
jgi:hypothetical protein